MKEFKNLVEATIRKHNANVYENKLEEIKKCCDDISRSPYLMIEVIGCEAKNDTFYLKFGTYYSEIRTNDPIYDVFDRADKILMYTVDKDNPDGALFVVEMMFEEIWKTEI